MKCINNVSQMVKKWKFSKNISKKVDEVILVRKYLEFEEFIHKSKNCIAPQIYHSLPSLSKVCA